MLVDAAAADAAGGTDRHAGQAHFGFFNRNLVMEYGHEQAVADGVNVDFDIYKIRTQITA
jgi:type I site-specific restriction endonuclease